MRLGWIALTAFRSYRDLHFEPDAGINVLVGDNGAGKTNLLEAIGFLATGRSFRGAPDEALIGTDQEAAIVRGEVIRDERHLVIEMELKARGGRRFLINRTKVARAGELAEAFRVVTFLPDDLDILKGGPGRRRELLDEAAALIWPAAATEQSEFDRVLRQRNAFLRRREADSTTLDVWDERLASAAGQVMVRRARSAALLEKPAAEAYQEIAGGASVVGFNYRSEWGGSLDPVVGAAQHQFKLHEVLGRNRRTDVERGLTTAGPQRDEPVILLNGQDMRYRASQGEQRSTALALRLATHRAVEEAAGEAAVLVLDDVFSELDPSRSSALVASLPEVQTFVSTAHEVPVSGRRYRVEEGTIR